ncbi:unnamed protein product (mitochondrion) [Plasmodiophora brassicae]|uniref:Uncharacterized protein n=1 Tax=Plasmodiophora brassicae TaxID=37360 RepID=A0A3P3YEQ5_PLABS|nr:unnamed protein product [Plasmodiophora brassicae]
MVQRSKVQGNPGVDLTGVSHNLCQRDASASCVAKAAAFRVFNVVVGIMALCVFVFVVLTTSLPVVLLRDRSQPWQSAFLQTRSSSFPASIYTSQELREGACEVHPPTDIDWKFIMGWKNPPKPVCDDGPAGVGQFTPEGYVHLDHSKCEGGIQIQVDTSTDPIAVPNGVEEIDVHDAEQVVVQCKHDDDKSSYDLLTRVVDKGTFSSQLHEARRQHAQSVRKRLPRLNLLFIMVDSLSREHALRAIPATLAYISETRPRSRLFDFTRYNTIGRGTKYNFSPIFLGKSGSEFHDETPTDERIPTIMSRYEDVGYMTAYIEEDCCENEGSMGRILGRKAFDDYEEEDVPMFRRAVQGISPHTFANVFCDIMPHMGVGGFFGEATRDKLCFAGDFIHNHVISYLKSFFNMFSRDEKLGGTFALWQNNIAHEASYTRVVNQDADLLEVIKHLSETVDDFGLIILGDHGLGFGGISDSPTLQFEYDLPALFMSLPDSFLDALPADMLDNLVAAQRKLVTGMDVYATLADLLLLDEHSQAYDRGISFLRPMPDRSCSEIGIPATRCSCATFAREDVNNLIWNSISHDLVGSLNEKTKPFPECLTLMTSKIKEVRRISESEGSVDTAYEVDLLVRPAQQGSWITENFVFALVKAAHWRPAPYTPPADQPDKKPPMRRWQIGTKFDTEKRTFEYEGVIYGVPSSIWMVFGWNTDDDATSSSPQRQIEALYFNANGESVVNFTMAVDADWDTSWHERDFDGLEIGSYSVRLVDRDTGDDMATAYIDIVEHEPVGLGERIFNAHWQITHTMRRSPFAPYGVCVPRGAPSDTCICVA